MPLCLASCGPDLNPIVRVSAKLEATLREACASRKACASTADDLWQAIGNALDEVSPSDCGNYLVNAGYSVQTGCAPGLVKGA